MRHDVTLHDLTPLAAERLERARAEAAALARARAAAAEAGADARWFVASTHGDAGRACGQLTEAGLDARAPTIAALKRRPRERGFDEIRVPLFTGYVFVRLRPRNEAFAGVLGFERIAALLGGDGVPRALPEATMAEIFALEVAPARPLSRRQMLIGGERVRVAAGPLMGLVGTALGPEALRTGTVDVEIDLFGRMTPCKLALDALDIVR